MSDIYTAEEYIAWDLTIDGWHKNDPIEELDYDHYDVYEMELT